MHSKLSRNSSSKVSEGSGLKICHIIIMEKETLTHGTEDKARKENLKISIPICRPIRATRSIIKTLESGVSSTTTPCTTQMNVS
jgi:hypothetical protein